MEIVSFDVKDGSVVGLTAEGRYWSAAEVISFGPYEKEGFLFREAPKLTYKGKQVWLMPKALALYLNGGKDPEII